MIPEGSKEGFQLVSRVDEVVPGTGRVVQVNGKAIALFNVDGRFYAISNTCPHEGGPLAEGRLKGCVVTCPWHDLAFDVRSGHGTEAPQEMHSSVINNAMIQASLTLALIGGVTVDKAGEAQTYLV